MQLSAVALVCGILRASLTTGFFVAMVGCTTNVEANATATTTEREPVTRAATAMSPTRPGDNFEGFERSLQARFDRSRMHTRELPGGDVLHVPNGHAAHAAILVKGPDGKLRRECISSSGEAAAVVKRLREEGGNP